MGIRIHKCIGYGLDDVKSVADDDRFLIDAIHSSKTKNSYEGKDASEKFYDFLNKKAKPLEEKVKAGKHTREEQNFLIDIQLITGFGDTSRDKHLYNSIVFHENVFMFVPPEMTKEWVRYDDTIDYSEFFLDHDEIEDSCRVIETGFYPYDGVYVDRRDGRRIPMDAAVNLRRFKDLDVGNGKNKLAYQNKLAENCGFKNIPEAEANITPQVPRSIHLLNEYLGICRTEALYSFKPMIFTYWC